MKQTERGVRDRSAAASLQASQHKAASAREVLYQELERSVDRSLSTIETAARRSVPLLWGAVAFSALLAAVAVVRLTRPRPGSALLKININIQPFPERHPVLAALAAAVVRQLFQELSARRGLGAQVQGPVAPGAARAGFYAGSSPSAGGVPLVLQEYASAPRE